MKEKGYKELCIFLVHEVEEQDMSRDEVDKILTLVLTFSVEKE